MCVENNAETETLTICDDIIDLAHQIGGEGFDELNLRDLEELFENIPLSDDEIFNSITTENDKNPESDCDEDVIAPLNVKTVGKIL